MDELRCHQRKPVESPGILVAVTRHPVDWNDLARSTASRAVILLTGQATGCLYLNPAFTVTCPKPTPDFFREVRARQAEWCRSASSVLPRAVRRRVCRWVPGGDTVTDKAGRYLHRAACFTGVLFHDGRLIHPTKWKELERRTLDCVPRELRNLQEPF